MNLRLPILCLMLLGIGSLVAGEPRLTDAEAIRLAGEAARKAGYDLDKYEKPSVRYFPDREGDFWSVFYKGKRRAPGNHFHVNVTDQTKKTELFAGS